MPTPTIWVLNTIITLPSNLIYNDIYGNPVTQLYPWDYLVLVGQNTNNIINNYKVLSNQVALNTSDIAKLQLLTSGITAPYVTPQINGQCLNGNTLENIDTLLEKQIVAWCSLVGLLGSNSSLSSAIAAQCAGLNSSPSFTIPTASMSSLSGWNSNVTTIAQSIQNLWITLCDARIGIENAIAATKTNCSQVIVNFAALLPSYSTGLNIYFQGYTYIPSGYTDNGSSITITDTYGHTYTSSINIVTLSNTSTPLNINLSATTLSATSNYVITINSNVTNSTLGLTCQKCTFQTFVNTLNICPTVTITPSNTSVAFILTPLLTTNVNYTVQLLNASGSTLQSLNYTNPTAIQIGSFTGLTHLTTYGINVIVTIISTDATTTCLTQPFTTTT
jgi:hypothetical protein